MSARHPMIVGAANHLLQVSKPHGWPKVALAIPGPQSSIQCTITKAFGYLSQK